MSKEPALYQSLRRKVIEDPREATRIFLDAFNRDDTGLQQFYDLLDRPSEGRLRQLVANALRNHVEKRRVLNHLVRWRSIETDEFTRRALEAVLADFDASSVVSKDAVANPDLGKISEVYRYVSSRLRHKMRNAMLGVQLRAAELQESSIRNVEGSVATAAARLEDAINKVGILLENTDVAPEHFRAQGIQLEPWLLAMNNRYAVQFSRIDLVIDGEDTFRCTIYASEYLLETAFWNIWINAQQAVNEDCRLTIRLRADGEDVELLIADNGPGFSAKDHDIAFLQEFSTSGSLNRGRGLLEVQDAIERLGGSIRLTEVAEDDYRIMIRIPTVKQ